MPITSNTISNFKLETLTGLPISDRICCLDDIVVSWDVLMTNCSDCSDVGYIELVGSSCINRCILQCGTDRHVFHLPHSHHHCDTGIYTLNFHRVCSDYSDSFSIEIDRFKTTVNTGNNQSILLGQTALLGSGTPESHTLYDWISNFETDVISDRNALNTIVRPCESGSHVLTVHARDAQFHECSQREHVHINVTYPMLDWSDVQFSDGGNFWLASGWLISSDAYTNTFHVTLRDLDTGLDLDSVYSDTPAVFSKTIQKPFPFGTLNYRVIVAMSDFEDCFHREYDFSLVKLAPTSPNTEPSLFEMLIRFFGILFAFIFFGIILNKNN